MVSLLNRQDNSSRSIIKFTKLKVSLLFPDSRVSSSSADINYVLKQRNGIMTHALTKTTGQQFPWVLAYNRPRFETCDVGSRCWCQQGTFSIAVCELHSWKTNFENLTGQPIWRASPQTDVTCISLFDVSSSGLTGFAVIVGNLVQWEQSIRNGMPKQWESTASVEWFHSIRLNSKMATKSPESQARLLVWRTDTNDWMLNLIHSYELDVTWASHVVGRFATHNSKQLSSFCASWSWPGCKVVDSFGFLD